MRFHSLFLSLMLVVGVSATRCAAKRPSAKSDINSLDETNVLTKNDDGTFTAYCDYGHGVEKETYLDLDAAGTKPEPCGRSSIGGTKLDGFPYTDIPVICTSALSSSEFGAKGESEPFLVRVYVDKNSNANFQIKRLVKSKEDSPMHPPLVIPIPGTLRGHPKITFHLKHGQFFEYGADGGMCEGQWKREESGGKWGSDMPFSCLCKDKDDRPQPGNQNSFLSIETDDPNFEGFVGITGNDKDMPTLSLSNKPNPRSQNGRKVALTFAVKGSLTRKLDKARVTYSMRCEGSGDIYELNTAKN